MSGRTSPSDVLIKQELHCEEQDDEAAVRVEDTWVKPEPCSPGGCGHFVKEEERSGGPKAAGGVLLKELHLIYEGHVMKEEELAIGPEGWHQPEPPPLLITRGLIYESTDAPKLTSHWHCSPSDASLSCDNSKKKQPFESNSCKQIVTEKPLCEERRGDPAGGSVVKCSGTQRAQEHKDLHLMYEGHVPKEELSIGPEVWQQPEPPALLITKGLIYESTDALEPTLHQHHTLSNGLLSYENSKKTPPSENNSRKQIVKEKPLCEERRGDSAGGSVTECSGTQQAQEHTGRGAEALHLMYEGHMPNEELAIRPVVWQQPEPPALLTSKGLIYESTAVLEPTLHKHHTLNNGSLSYENSKKTQTSENNSCKQIVKEKPLCEERRGDSAGGSVAECSGTQQAQEHTGRGAEALHLMYEGHMPNEELAIRPVVWQQPEPPALLTSKGLIYESTAVLETTLHQHHTLSNVSLSYDNSKKTQTSENNSCKQIVKEKPLCEERRGDSAGGLMAECSGTQRAQEHTGRGAEALHLMYEGHMPNEELAMRPDVWQQPEPPALLTSKGLIYESTAVLEPTLHQHHTLSNVSLSYDNSKKTQTSENNSCKQIVKEKPLCEERRGDSAGGLMAECSGTQRAQEHTGRGAEALHLMYEGHMPNEELAMRPEVWQQPEPPALLTSKGLIYESTAVLEPTLHKHHTLSNGSLSYENSKKTQTSENNSCKQIVKEKPLCEERRGDSAGGSVAECSGTQQAQEHTGRGAEALHLMYEGHMPNEELAIRPVVWQQPEPPALLTSKGLIYESTAVLEPTLHQHHTLSNVSLSYDNSKKTQTSENNSCKQIVKEKPLCEERRGDSAGGLMAECSGTQRAQEHTGRGAEALHLMYEGHIPNEELAMRPEVWQQPEPPALLTSKGLIYESTAVLEPTLHKHHNPSDGSLSYDNSKKTLPSENNSCKQIVKEKPLCEESRGDPAGGSVVECSGTQRTQEHTGRGAEALHLMYKGHMPNEELAIRPEVWQQPEPPAVLTSKGLIYESTAVLEPTLHQHHTLSNGSLSYDKSKKTQTSENNSCKQIVKEKPLCEERRGDSAGGLVAECSGTQRAQEHAGRGAEALHLMYEGHMPNEELAMRPEVWQQPEPPALLTSKGLIYESTAVLEPTLHKHHTPSDGSLSYDNSKKTLPSENNSCKQIVKEKPLCEESRGDPAGGSVVDCSGMQRTQEHTGRGAESLHLMYKGHMPNEELAMRPQVWRQPKPPPWLISRGFIYESTAVLEPTSQQHRPLSNRSLSYENSKKTPPSENNSCKQIVKAKPLYEERRGDPAGGSVVKCSGTQRAQEHTGRGAEALHLMYEGHMPNEELAMRPEVWRQPQPPPWLISRGLIYESTDAREPTSHWHHHPSNGSLSCDNSKKTQSSENNSCKGKPLCDERRGDPAGGVAAECSGTQRAQEHTGRGAETLHLMYEGHMPNEKLAMRPEVWRQHQQPPWLISRGLIYESTPVLEPTLHQHHTLSNGSLSCDNSKKTQPSENNSCKEKPLCEEHRNGPAGGPTPECSGTQNAQELTGRGAEALHLMYEGHMPNEELAIRPEVWRLPEPPALLITRGLIYESTNVLLDPSLHWHHTPSNGSLSCDNSKKTPPSENNSCKQIVREKPLCEERRGDPAGGSVANCIGTQRAQEHIGRGAEALHLMFVGRMPNGELAIGSEVWQQPEPPALLTSEGLISAVLESPSHQHRTPSTRSISCENSKKTPSFENSCNNIVQSTNITHEQATLRPFRCHICNEEFPDDLNLTAHFRVHHQSFACNICSEKFAERSSQMRHLLTHGEKPYTCDICNMKVLHKSDLITHIRIHTGEKPYSCDICNKKFANSGRVRTHKVIHHGEKKPSFFCDICNMKFLWKWELIVHLRYHTGERPYKCNICYSSFTRNRALTEHLENCHSGEKCFACNICDEKFAKKVSLNNHVLIHGGAKPYYIHHVCQYCNKKFSRRHDLMVHLRIHTGEKPHNCDICEKKFLTKQQLTSHLRVHSGEKPYSCEICGRKFRALGSLTIHLHVHGAGKKKVTCDVCNKSFPHEGYLKRHQLVHSGEKNFPCNLCDKKFAQKCTLTRHLGIHRGEKFTCDVCGKKFSQKGTLTRHRRVHSEENKFTCDSCDKTFTAKSKLASHIKNAHKT